MRNIFKQSYFGIYIVFYSQFIGLVNLQYCNFIKEFNNLFYLSMSIIWKARVGTFFPFKLVLKWKSRTRDFPFLQNSVYFPLYIGKFLLNSAYNCMLTEDFLEPYVCSKFNQTYITQHNYDLMCFSKTFLNSSIHCDKNRIKIDQYNLSLYLL